MKEFVHNGETVKYQEIQDENFLNLLNNAGIIPEEIPDENLNYRVFKYEKDNKKIYACVLVANDPETYVEKVYMTYEIPEDGFYNMMLDVTGQLGGAEPKAVRSRLSIASQEAFSRANKWIQKRYPDNHLIWSVMGYPEEIQNEYNDVVKQALQHFGYSLKTLDMISAPDVDMEYMKNLMK